MMRCARAQEELSAYLDEELTAQEKAELRAHLDGCAACRAELEALRATVDSVRALPRTPAPAGFRDGVMAKLKEAPAPAAGGTGQPAPSFRAPLWRRLWPVAAAIVVALMISLFYPTPRPAHLSARSLAKRGEPVARDTQFDKMEAAKDEGAMGKGIAAAPAAAPAATAAPAGEKEVALAERAGSDAENAAIGKAGPPVALKKDSDHFLAKGAAASTGVVSNAIEDYSMAKTPAVADQRLAGAGAPVEIVIASADPDYARQVARDLLEKRGWLARADVAAAKGGAMAKAAPPRANQTIQLNLLPDQVALLREDLKRAGLVMADQAGAAPRDQAVQNLAAAVKLEEEKQVATRQAAPAAPATQQMTQQRSPDLAVQSESAQSQRAATVPVPVLLKFVAVQALPAQDADMNQATPNPPPAQAK